MQSVQEEGLSSEQQQFFERNGYLILKDCVSADVLGRLQEASEQWLHDVQQLHEQGLFTPDAAIIPGSDGKQHCIRINCVHTKGNTVSLEVLGLPALIAAARSLCGEGEVISTYESLLVKEDGDNQLIPWHQDALYDRSYRVITAGIYLDDSRRDGGCLLVLPGSQHQKQDICAHTERYGYNAADLCAVEVNAGDILLHDAMVVHASAPVTSPVRRRTVYFEFRSAEEQRKDGFQTKEWIEKRLQLQELAARYYSHLHQKPDAELSREFLDAELKRLTERTRSRAGNFCIENIPTTMM